MKRSESRKELVYYAIRALRLLTDERRFASTVKSNCPGLHRDIQDVISLAEDSESGQLLGEAHALIQNLLSAQATAEANSAQAAGQTDYQDLLSSL